MNTSAFAFCKHAFVARARGSPSKYAFVIFTYFFATQAFAWTDGELLIWITGNRPFHALTHLGKIFDREIGAPVYNKKLVTGKVPAQLSELPAFASQRKVENPKAIVIMWDYKTPTSAGLFSPVPEDTHSRRQPRATMSMISEWQTRALSKG